MNRWQKWLLGLCGISLKGTLDTERALREKNRRIIELEQENAGLKSRLWHPKLVHVEIDPAGQKQAQAQIGTYEPPERTTDPTQLGIRRRATMHRFQENPGILMQHHAEMHKRAQTVKLDPETVQLPNVNPLRKLTMQRYDGPPLPDTTMASIPTWIL